MVDYGKKVDIKIPYCFV